MSKILAVVSFVILTTDVKNIKLQIKKHKKHVLKKLIKTF